jgi:hypothetical protein
MEVTPQRNRDEVPRETNPDNLAGLIRKLRWIGMEDEAQRLEMRLSCFPPEQRGTVSAGPFSTD